MITLPLKSLTTLLSTYNTELLTYSVNKYYSFFSFLSAYVLHEYEGKSLICLIDMRVCQLVGTYSLSLSDTLNPSDYNFSQPPLFLPSIRFHEDTLLLQEAIFFSNEVVIPLNAFNEVVIPLNAFTFISKSYEDYFKTFLSDYSFYLRTVRTPLPNENYEACLISCGHIKDILHTQLISSINSLPPL